MTPTPPRFQPQLERDGVVVVLIARGIKQRDRSVPQPGKKFLRGGLASRTFQLLAYSHAKRLPVIRLAVELLAQRIARRDVLQPQVDPRLLLGHAARP